MTSPRRRATLRSKENLVQFQRANGTCLVPLFTEALHVTRALPAPAKLVRVQLRVLLGVEGVHPFQSCPAEKLRSLCDAS